MKKETTDKKKKTTFWLSKYYFYLSIIGIISFGYLAFDALVKKEWLDAFVDGFLGVSLFANPIYQGLKKK